MVDSGGVSRVDYVCQLGDSEVGEAERPAAVEDDPTYMRDNSAAALVHKDKCGTWLGQWGVDETGAGSRQQRERL